MKKILYTLLCCLAWFVAPAQNDFGFFNEGDPDRPRVGQQRDSSAKEGPTVPHFRTAWQWTRGGLYKKFVPLDSLTDGIHNYNVIFKRDVSNTYLGNFPSPYESNIFIHRERGQYLYALNTVRAYLFKPEDALEFNVTTPFTRIDYFNGGGKAVSENWLDVWHVQNIRPYWSAGFRYNLVSSTGSYTYQKSKVYNFALFSSYERRRVAASLFVNQNMGHFNENGGAADFSEIRDTIMNSRYVLTRLNNEPNNNYQNFNLQATVQYNIGKGKPAVTPRDTATPPEVQLPEVPLPPVPLPAPSLADSLLVTARDSIGEISPADTVAVDSLPRAARTVTADSLAVDSLPEVAMTYPMKVVLSARVERNYHTFRETSVENAFFPAWYIDSISHANLYENNALELDARLVVNEHPRYAYLPGVHAGVTYRRLGYRQRTRVDQDSTTVDFGTSNYSGAYLTAGMFNIDSTDLLHFDASGSLCMLGDYLGDYDLNGEITWFPRRDRRAFARVTGSLKRETPNPFLEFYLGNHDRWDSPLDKILSQELTGSLHHPGLRAEVGVALTNIVGHVYLDTFATPRQDDGSLFVLTAWAKQVFKLGHFFFDQKVYYQVSGSPGVLSLPRVALYSHNYYQNTFFKGALGFQGGVDLFYNTAFHASAYAPATMQFHQQREGLTGNYPKVDLFIALRVKRADIFIKYEHASLYVANRDYFSAYAYPINPARVKYGIRWNFFD
jgi:hypothetical protein